MAELRFAYAARGYDYAGAIERVAGDEELLHSLLDMFAADESFLKLMSALDAHDALEGFHAAHSLKGSSGMLGMTGLYEAMKLIIEPLRTGEADRAMHNRAAREKALQYRAEVEREYAAAVGMIECL
ncbi:putative uncharacterized protein [Firmicutes bacterium CAG:240]|nr:putative uncharacterized protein [Firmicutes bacterium CAG:240]